MNLMLVKQVNEYFKANKLVGNFWNDLVFVDEVAYIPCYKIKEAIGANAFREMECHVSTLVNEELEPVTRFDLYSSLRYIGLTHDQCDEVTE